MIILLNGPSSSGKTSIARAIQKRWPRPIVHIGTFVFMSLIDKGFIGKKNKKNILGFYFRQEIVNKKRVQVFCKGLYGKRIQKSSFESTKILIENKNDVVIEEVISENEDLNEYLSVLEGQKVYFIGIRCSIKVIEEREKERGDRIPGQSRSVYSKVHPVDRVYDLEIDTSRNSPDECAISILNYVSKNNSPKAWKKLYLA